MQDGRNVNLIFHIEEGTRYTVKSDPHISGNEAVPIEGLDQLLHVKAGRFYNQDDVDDDMERIKEYYGNTGREAKVQSLPVISKQPGRVTVRYEVEEGPVARVGGLFIVGTVHEAAFLLWIGMTHEEVEKALGERATFSFTHGPGCEEAFYPKTKIHVGYNPDGKVVDFHEQR